MYKVAAFCFSCALCVVGSNIYTLYEKEKCHISCDYSYYYYSWIWQSDDEEESTDDRNKDEWQ